MTWLGNEDLWGQEKAEMSRAPSRGNGTAVSTAL